ncbi:MAG: N-acetylmuramoyl-L-alanine amidase [Syntrophaceae bacterium]|nr:N-acetylmuramoyl-L-alanine amidase [Syntrophaceae bacterium]
MSYKKKILLLCFLICFLVFFSLELSAAGKKHVIIINPGHGGKDKGIELTKDVTEKDITLAVALAMRKELTTGNNIEFVLMRDSDKTVDLEERRKIIEEIKPDFLISLHVNGGFGKNASGFEIYYPEFGEDIIKEEKTVKDKKQKKNKLQNDSLTMAKIIQENLNVLFPRKGRGVRKADMPLTDGLLVPSVVVEMSFATNTEDKKKLLSRETQKDVAEALVKSCKKFFR